MSKIGYIIVSTEHQETARQQKIMCDYQVDRIFSEKLSGANGDRPQLRAMLEYVREGDTLYIESISRLGRSTKGLLNIIDTLTAKGVTLISHKDKLDTDTPETAATPETAIPETATPESAAPATPESAVTPETAKTATFSQTSFALSG